MAANIAENPLQRLFSQVTVTEHLFNLQSDFVVQYRALRGQVSAFSRFALSKPARTYAGLLGVPCDPEAPGTHSHPLSKLLEEYMLCVEVPALFTHGSELAVLQMRPSKFRRTLAGSVGPSTSLHNYVLEPKDRVRFGDDQLPPPLGGPRLPQPNWFCHDFLHYLTPRDVHAMFFNNPGLTHLAGTLVIPPGLLTGCQQLETPLYHYRVSGPNLIYAPDGNYAEAYSQPASCVWWLRTRYLQDLGTFVSITILRQHDSHFLVLCSRGKTHVAGTTLVDLPGLAELPLRGPPSVFPSLFPPPTQLVPRQAALFVQSYVTSVSPPTPTQLRARLRIWLQDRPSITLDERQTRALVWYGCRLLQSARHNTPPPFSLYSLFSLGLAGHSGARRFLDAAEEDSLRPPLLRLNPPPWHLTGASPASPFTSGAPCSRDTLEIRSVLRAVLDPPSGPKPPPPAIDTLLGAHPGYSLSYRALDYSARVAYLAGAYHALRKFPCRVPVAPLLAAATQAYSTLGPFAVLALLPPASFLALLASEALLTSVRLAHQKAITQASRLARRAWFACCRACPRLFDLDLALHSLLTPNDAPLAYHLDPGLAHAMYASPGVNEPQPPAPSPDPPAPSQGGSSGPPPPPPPPTPTPTRPAPPTPSAAPRPAQPHPRAPGAPSPPPPSSRPGQAHPPAAARAPPGTRTVSPPHGGPVPQFKTHSEGTGEHLLGSDHPLPPPGSWSRVDVLDPDFNITLLLSALGDWASAGWICTCRTAHAAAALHETLAPLACIRTELSGATLRLEFPEHSLDCADPTQAPAPSPPQAGEGLPASLIVPPGAQHHSTLATLVESHPDRVCVLRDTKLTDLSCSAPLPALCVDSRFGLLAFPVSLVGMGPPLPPSPPRDSGVCLLDALEDSSGLPRDVIWEAILGAVPPRAHPAVHSGLLPLGTPHLLPVANRLGLTVWVHSGFGTFSYGSGPRPAVLTHSHNHWSGCARYPPPRSTLPSSSSPLPPGACPSLRSALVELCGDHSARYRLSLRRASAALKALQGGHIGYLLPRNQELLSKLRSLVDAPPPHSKRSLTLRGVLGEPGTGKSYPLLTACQRYSDRQPARELFTVLFGTDALRNEQSKTLRPPPGRGYRLKTWERAFTEPLHGCVIIDDAGVFPPVLDLLLLAQPGVSEIFFTGDLAQNLSEAPPAAPDSHLLRPTLELLKPGAGLYLRHGRRLPPDVAGHLGVRTASLDPGLLRVGRATFGPVIVATQGAVATYTGLGRPAFTPLTCQGSTFDKHTTLCVSTPFLLASDRAVYTALTRCRTDLWLSEDRGNFVPYLRASSPILRGLAQYCLTRDSTQLTEAVRDHRMRHTPAHLSDPTRQPGRTPRPLDLLAPPPPTTTTLLGRGLLDGLRDTLTFLCDRPSPSPPPDRTTESWYCGRSDFSLEKRAESLEAAPSLALHLDALPPVAPLEDFPTSRPPPPAPSPGLPYTLHSDFSAWSPVYCFTHPSAFATLMECLYPGELVDFREARFRGESTAQVDTSDYATAVFLRHRRRDRATEAWTFHERHLPPRRPQVTYLGGGSALFQSFLATYQPAQMPWNEAVYEQCIQEDEGSLLAKGPKALRNISYRNDPMLDPHLAETFLKSQDITKLGAAYRRAKKGQMITGFITRVNVRFGPLTRYLYRALRTSLPPEILLLNGVTLEDQAKWFSSHWDWSAPCYEDDYTSFDSTQNEEFLYAQTLLMAYYGVPPPLVAEFIELMTNLRTSLGPNHPWIPSGLKPTWLFNTFDNMAYQALKHDLTPHSPGTPAVARAFSGDDSLHNESIRVRPAFARLPHKFSLVSTGSHTPTPHFCGTVNLPTGTFADPKLLLTRVLFRARLGTLGPSALGYAEHASRLQSALEASSEHLSALELSCHATTVRFLRFYLRLAGIPYLGFFLTRLLAHSYNLLLP